LIGQTSFKKLLKKLVMKRQRRNDLLGFAGYFSGKLVYTITFQETNKAVTFLYRGFSFIEGYELLNTPAFVYSEDRVIKSVKVLQGIKFETKIKLLFPLKSFSIADALCHISVYFDGFSASSMFEAKLAWDLQGDGKLIHITTPGMKIYEVQILSELCDYISFNSLSQYGRCLSLISNNVSCGLRINPQLTFVKDERYNPCRKHSKLGVPLNTLREISENGSKVLQNMKGIHFHTNCESEDFDPLFKTVQHIDAQLHKLRGQIEWINLGGGYLFEEGQNFDRFVETVNFLRNKYDVDVFFEPGKAIVGDAGYIVSSVVDIFESDGKTIAILDTSVNHMPEVFEYQYRPDVMQETEDGAYEYTLAGCTCLAGDLFGEYRFEDPLEIGSHIVFEGMGAYTLVKANMFNGVNLPSIYAHTTDGKLELKKQFGYEDFKSRCGA